MRRASLPVQATLFTITRMVLNMNTRIVYPFLPVIARGLGVGLADISLVMSVRSIIGALSPFVTPIADRRGRRFGMLLGMTLFIAALAVLVFWPSLWTFLIAQSLAFLAMFICVSSIQAYLGDSVPYRQRGLVIGLTELGWAGAFVLGMPLIGWIISRVGWLAPFPLIMGLAVVMLVLLAWIVPGGRPAEQPAGGLLGGMKQVLSYGPALAGLALSASATAGNEVINLVFGDWMETTFALNILALGAASSVIGIAEMCGEGLTAWLADRVGKERAVAVGFSMNGLVALALPWLGSTQTGALIGLFMLYLTFEFAIVSSVALITEVMPWARASLLGANVAAFSVGRGVGALLAPLAYSYGFRVNTLVTVALTLVALYALSRIRLPAASARDTMNQEA